MKSGIRRGILWVLCAGLLGLSMLAGCAAQTEAPLPFRARVDEILETFDPAAGTGATYLSHIYEGLTRLDAQTGEALAGMASKWKVSEDGLTYTFTLRRAKWSDGEPVTAQDFVYAWQRAIGMEKAVMGSPFRYIDRGEEIIAFKADASTLGVSAEGKRTLVVQLAQPYPLFPQLCSLPGMYPLRQDVVEAGEDWKAGGEAFVGNGPYLLSRYEAGAGLLVSRNPQYHGRKQLVQEAVFFDLSLDADGAMKALESGGLDFTNVFDEYDMKNLSQLPYYRTAPALGTGYLNFATLQAPFDDARVRKAFSLALDRRELAEIVLARGAVPAEGLVGLGFLGQAGGNYRQGAGSYGSIDDVEGNIAQAKELLAQAGYGQSNPFPPVEYVYNATSLNKPMAQAMQRMWRDNLGVDVVMSGMDWEAFAQLRDSGTFQICRQALGAGFPDPLLVLERFVSGCGDNDPCYMNAEYDALIVEISQEKDAQAREEKIQAAEALLMADMAVAPLYYYASSYFVPEGYSGEVSTPMGSWFFGFCTDVQEAEGLEEDSAT